MDNRFILPGKSFLHATCPGTSFSKKYLSDPVPWFQIQNCVMLAGSKIYGHPIIRNERYLTLMTKLQNTVARWRPTIQAANLFKIWTVVKRPQNHNLGLWFLHEKWCHNKESSCTQTLGRCSLPYFIVFYHWAVTPKTPRNLQMYYNLIPSASQNGGFSEVKQFVPLF